MHFLNTTPFKCTLIVAVDARQPGQVFAGVGPSYERIYRTEWNECEYRECLGTGKRPITCPHTVEAIYLLHKMFLVVATKKMFK